MCRIEDEDPGRHLAGLDHRLKAKTASKEGGRTENTWMNEQYKGINSRWREPESSQVFELQFHTRASFEAKQLTHPAYERIRNPDTLDDERAELEVFQAQVNKEIPIPPGAAEIEDHPRKGHNG